MDAPPQTQELIQEEEVEMEQSAEEGTNSSVDEASQKVQETQLEEASEETRPATEASVVFNPLTFFEKASVIRSRLPLLSEVEVACIAAKQKIDGLYSKDMSVGFWVGNLSVPSQTTLKRALEEAEYPVLEDGEGTKKSFKISLC